MKGHFIHTEKIAISLVVPFFNEEEVVDTFFKKTSVVLKTLGKSYEIICVNDGSTDATLERLLKAKKHYPCIRIINLSRNFGKEAALTAGLDHSKGEAVIPIDSDLQDPPELISDFVDYWEQGYDVVLAKRVNRSSDTAGKRLTAKLFYKWNNKISNIEIPENIGDYRLMSRKVVTAIKELPESQRFMKGIFAWVGFKSKVVNYTRDKRQKGKTSFNWWKLWNFALEGITSFSTLPLRVWLYIGMFICSMSFIYGSFIVLKTLFWGVDVPGYASMLTSILFLGGMQLLGIGVLGEYIGRIYIESKRRPIYIIENQY